MRLPSGSRFISARAVRVLPQPLSPTIASASPAWRSKSTPSTAGKKLPPIGSSTFKSRTERRGGIGSISSDLRLLDRRERRDRRDWNRSRRSRAIASRSSILPDRLQVLHAVHDVAVVGVQAVDLEKGLVGQIGLARRLKDAGEVVKRAERLGLLDVRSLQPLSVPLDGELRHPFLEKTEAQHAAALDRAGRILARKLELPDRFVDQPHFLIGNPEVEMRLVVFGRELLLNAPFELAEDLLERCLPLRTAHVGRRDRRGLLGKLPLELLGEIEELLLV